MSQEDTKKKKGGGIPVWARFLISFGLLGLILYKVDLKPLAEIGATANVPLVALAFVMIFVDQVVTALAWGKMLHAANYPIPYKDMIRVTLASDFIGLAVPSGMGPDMVRVVGLSRYIESPSHALSSLFAFRVMGLGQTITIAAVVMAFFSGNLPDDPMFGLLRILVILLFIAGFTCFVFMGRIERALESFAPRTRLEPLMIKVRDLYSTFLFYLRHKDALVAAFLGAFYVQMAKILSIYVIAMALGLDVSVFAFFVLVPVINMLILLPVSMAGLGVREGGYVLLFGHMGLGAAQCLTMSLLGFAVNMLVVCAGGIVYLFSGFPNNEGLQKAKPPEE